jgi:hypothetical protein
MSKKSVELELWKKGATIYEAVARFGSRRKVERLGQLDHPFISTAHMITAFCHMLDGRSEEPKAAEERLKSVNEYQDLWKELERELYANLRLGALYGLGFIGLRTPESLPRFVPAEVWPGNIDWKNSNVTSDGYEFSAVRIVHSILLDEYQAQSKPRFPLNPGRPTLAPFIEEAFKELKSEGALDQVPTTNKKACLIRERIWGKHPELSRSQAGLSKNVMYREINKIMKNNNN